METTLQVGPLDERWHALRVCRRPVVWMGWVSFPKGIMETYKWMLSGVFDTHGNSIIFTYGRVSWVGQGSCGTGNPLRGTVDQTAWPSIITWGSGTNRIQHRHRVRFLSSPRQVDYFAEGPEDQYGRTISEKGLVRETRQLNEMVVESKQGTAWETVRSYLFDYTTSDAVTSDLSKRIGTSEPKVYEEDTSTRKLTLTGFQVVGNDRTYDRSIGSDYDVTSPEQRSLR